MKIKPLTKTQIAQAKQGQKEKRKWATIINTAFKTGKALRVSELSRKEARSLCSALSKRGIDYISSYSSGWVVVFPRKKPPLTPPEKVETVTMPMFEKEKAPEEPSENLGETSPLLLNVGCRAEPQKRVRSRRKKENE